MKPSITELSKTIKNATLSIMTLNTTAVITVMLSVAFETIILSVTVLSVIMLSVRAPLSVMTLCGKFCYAECFN